MSIDTVAIQAGRVTIHWYGIFVAFGFVTGLAVLHWRAGRSNVPRDRVADLGVAAILGGLIGARLFYVIVNIRDYLGTPLEIVRIDKGGLVFYGGFIGAAAAVVWIARRIDLDVLEVADLFALAVPVAQALGRVGCFIRGCCHGTPSQQPPSVLYLPDSDIFFVQRLRGLINSDAVQCLPVHPTQVYQSLTNMIIWGMLLALAGKLKGRGQLFAAFVALYATGRFIIEFFRGDYLPTQYYGPFTVAQVICLILLPVGSWMFWKFGHGSRS